MFAADVPELADLNVTVSGSTVAGSGPKITHEGVLELGKQALIVNEILYQLFIFYAQFHRILEMSQGPLRA